MNKKYLGISTISRSENNQICDIDHVIILEYFQIILHNIIISRYDIEILATTTIIYILNIYWLNKNLTGSG